MFNWFAQLSFAQLSWLSIIAYMLHYAEEGPRLVAWFQNHYNGRMAANLNYTQKKLNLENALLFSFMLFTVILFNLYPNSLIMKIAIFGSGIGLVGNTLFHVIPTLRDGIYSPGVVTASMVFPLVLLTYIWKMNQEGLLTLPIILGATLPGVVLLPLFVHLTHNVILRNE